MTYSDIVDKFEAVGVCLQKEVRRRVEIVVSGQSWLGYIDAQSGEPVTFRCGGDPVTLPAEPITLDSPNSLSSLIYSRALPGSRTNHSTPCIPIIDLRKRPKALIPSDSTRAVLRKASGRLG